MNRNNPIQISELMESLKTKPIVIDGTVNIIALNELRKNDYAKFQEITNQLKQRTI